VPRLSGGLGAGAALTEIVVSYVATLAIFAGHLVFHVVLTSVTSARLVEDNSSRRLQRRASHDAGARELAV
jgi:hypothetical protein